MITIHHFVVPIGQNEGGSFPVKIDPTARIVEVRQLSMNAPGVEFWAIVDTTHKSEERQFAIHGTGHPIPPGQRYVGTAPGPTFVWHLFEVVA